MIPTPVRLPIGHETLVDDFRSYTEVSPSGSRREDLRRRRAPASLSRNKIVMGKANGAHPPAIEPFVAGRWFAVTGLALDDVPDEIVDATEAWEQLAHRLAEHARAKPNGRPPRTAGTEPIERLDVPERFTALLANDPRLRAALAR